MRRVGYRTNSPHKDSHQSTEKPIVPVYPYELTEGVLFKDELDFVVKQLVAAGGVENLDWEWRHHEKSGKWSVWNLRKY